MRHLQCKNEAGCNSFTAGGVVAVPANTLHSAENPSCKPLRAMQALSGGVGLVASELCCIAVMVTSEPKLVKPILQHVAACKFMLMRMHAALRA